MHSFFRNFAIGVGSIVLAPAGMVPPAGFRITIPPRNATEALGHDFGQVARHLTHAIEQVEVEHAEQMELGLERNA